LCTRGQLKARQLTPLKALFSSLFHLCDQRIHGSETNGKANPSHACSHSKLTARISTRKEGRIRRPGNHYTHNFFDVAPRGRHVCTIPKSTQSHISKSLQGNHTRRTHNFVLQERIRHRTYVHQDWNGSGSWICYDQPRSQRCKYLSSSNCTPPASPHEQPPPAWQNMSLHFTKTVTASRSVQIAKSLLQHHSIRNGMASLLTLTSQIGITWMWSYPADLEYAVESAVEQWVSSVQKEIHGVGG
jgi:hypothetical protein